MDGKIENGVYEEYIFLDICEKYGLNPITEFDPLPDIVKKMMKAKWELDRDLKMRMNKSNKD